MNASAPRISHLVAGLAGLLWCLGAAAAAPDAALKAAVGNPARSPNFVTRDKARHPAEELAFFGIKPNMTVVELWPGGGYWTEILGPYLAKQGTYYVALEPSNNTEAEQGNAKWHTRIDAMKGQIGTIHETSLGAGHFDIAPPGSADLVLTFRNLHNWMDGGYAEQALAACFTALKPGGILGIEEHRGRKDKPQDPKACRRLRARRLRDRAREEGRIRAGRIIRNQRQPQRHEGLGGWRVDPATYSLSGR